MAITVPVLLALCSPPGDSSVSSVELPVLLAGSKSGVHLLRGTGSREHVCMAMLDWHSPLCWPTGFLEDTVTVHHDG